MNRRQFLGLAGVSSVGLMGWRFWPEQGIWNPCLPEVTPAELLNHDLVESAWQGIDPDLMWDCHVHLVGTGDSNSGIHVNPEMQSLMHPIQFTQFRFYLNASCVTNDQDIDRGYVDRLLRLHHDFRPGTKLMLLAFEHYHDEHGQQQPQHSPFHVPNSYAAKLAQLYPDSFEWIASIHPYREDCVEALQQAVAGGARAVKWLPGAMGIDPSSPQCDRFYATLIKHGIPLLTHAGLEMAVNVEGGERLNNPLLLRRPLEQGVKVVIAHCASIGESDDLDRNSEAKIHNLELFARLMDESSYEQNLFGDVSAILQVNRKLEVIEQIYQTEAWHPRLINGSDYPLPGVMPVFNLQWFVEAGYLPDSEAKVLSQIRRYNPLFFDFLLKRSLKIKGSMLLARVFESRRLFDNG